MSIPVFDTIRLQQRPDLVVVGLCKDCKHWGEEPQRGYGYPHMSDDGRRHLCTLINSKAIPSVCELPQVGLDSGDYASSDAQLWTAPDFGCVLFEAKS